MNGLIVSTATHNNSGNSKRTIVHTNSELWARPTCSAVNYMVLLCRNANDGRRKNCWISNTGTDLTASKCVTVLPFRCVSNDHNFPPHL